MLRTQGREKGARDCSLQFKFRRRWVVSSFLFFFSFFSLSLSFFFFYFFCAHERGSSLSFAWRRERYGFRAFIAHKAEEMNESVSKDATSTRALRRALYRFWFVTDPASAIYRENQATVPIGENTGGHKQLRKKKTLTVYRSSPRRIRVSRQMLTTC